MFLKFRKLTLFLQLIHRAFALCDDGGALLPSQICDYEINCADSSDEISCALLREGSMISVTSPDYPGNYPNEQDVVWIIPAEEGTRIHLHFEDFDLESGYDYLNIGIGSKPSEDTLSYPLTGSDVPEDFIVNGNTIWLNFVSDSDVAHSGFRAVIGVMSESESFVCTDGLVLLNNRVCNFLVDCTNTEDEQNCPPVPEGWSVTITSPGFPFSEYPDSFTETYIFNTKSELAIKLTFTAFDLEDRFDTLVVGYGQNSTEDSSIISSLTGSNIPQDIISPTMSLWMTFSTDISNTEDGFSVTVTATTPPEVEQCSQFLQVKTSIQTLQRQESTRGRDCGIAVMSCNKNKKVRLVFQRAEFDCMAGEFLVVTSTEVGRSHQRETYCGTYSELVINSEDGVALIEYHINMVGHGFTMTHRSVGRTSNFRGCNQLIPLVDGQVIFTSPRYPRKYRPRQRCEYRIVASPGKKISLSFSTFILQSDERCRKDYVRIADLIKRRFQRYCGVHRNLMYNSGSNYVSVVFRSGERRQFKGFRTEATETN